MDFADTQIERQRSGNSEGHVMKGRERESYCGKPPINQVGLPLWKRTLDIGCIVVAAPVLLPVMLAIGAVIKIVSPGPALFRQVRIGYRGEQFTCFKFRTMFVNADTSVH